MSKKYLQSKFIDHEDIILKIASDIIRVAKETNHHPASLPPKIFFENSKFEKEILDKYGGYLFIRNTFFEHTADRVWHEIIKFKDLRKKYNQIIKYLGNIDLYIQDIFSYYKNKGLPVIKISKNLFDSQSHKIPTKRVLTLLLSDLHIGLDLDKKYHKYTYSRLEESRALAAVIKNVCEYKLSYRNETELIVNILGDIIQNIIHNNQHADYLHIQTARAIWLLSQAIAVLSSAFKKVTINFIVGNHGRDSSIHPERAISLKFNAIETTIYYAVKMICNKLKNVTFNQPLTPYFTYKVFNFGMYATHGDTHLVVGNTSKNININAITNKINQINAAIDNHEEQYRVFMVGHVHHPLITTTTSGAFLVVNGTLTPPDDYAQSLGIMSNQLTQVMFESTMEYPIGDIRIINVTNELSNSKLDKIIVPFSEI